MFFSYIRKRSFLNIKEIRLIMLMDILRKLWTGLILRQIADSYIRRRAALSLPQHLYLPRRGSVTANLQLLNTFWSLPGTNANSLIEVHLGHDAKGVWFGFQTCVILFSWQHLGVPYEMTCRPGWIGLYRDGYCNYISKRNVMGPEGCVRNFSTLSVGRAKRENI